MYKATLNQKGGFILKLGRVEAAPACAGSDTNALFFRYEVPCLQEPSVSVTQTVAPQAASQVPDLVNAPRADNDRVNGSDEEDPSQPDEAADQRPATDEAAAPSAAEENGTEQHDTGATDGEQYVGAPEHANADTTVERSSVADAPVRDNTESVPRSSAPEAACLVPAEPRLVLSTSNEGHTSGTTAYIVKGHDGRVGEEDMKEHINIGVLTEGDTLSQLSSLLEQVFLQSIMDTASKNSSDVSKAHVPAGQQPADDAELLAALQKFVGQLKTSEVHLTGSVQLAMPQVDASALAAKDDDLLAVLESTMHEWTIVLQDVKLAEAEKCAQGEGPLDEIHFWRERNNVLGGLHEQINLSRSQAIIEYVINRLALFGSVPQLPSSRSHALHCCMDSRMIAGTLSATPVTAHSLPTSGAMWLSFQSWAWRPATMSSS